MPENTPRLPRDPKPVAPMWARATRLFYGKSLDVRSKKDFVEAMQDFAELSPAEQAFHQTQLQFRQIQALEDIFGVLGRIEKGLAGLNLTELTLIRKSLKALVVGQEEMLDMMDAAQEGTEEAEAELVDADPPSAEELPEEIVEEAPEGPLEGEVLPAPEKRRRSTKKRTGNA